MRANRCSSCDVRARIDISKRQECYLLVHGAYRSAKRVFSNYNRLHRFRTSSDPEKRRQVLSPTLTFWGSDTSLVARFISSMTYSAGRILIYLLKERPGSIVALLGVSIWCWKKDDCRCASFAVDYWIFDIFLEIEGWRRKYIVFNVSGRWRWKNVGTLSNVRKGMGCSRRSLRYMQHDQTCCHAVVREINLQWCDDSKILAYTETVVKFSAPSWLHFLTSRPIKSMRSRKCWDTPARRQHAITGQMICMGAWYMPVPLRVIAGNPVHLLIQLHKFREILTSTLGRPGLSHTLSQV